MVMATALKDVLARHHMRVTETQFLADLDQALSGMAWRTRSRRVKDEFLLKHGGVTLPEDRDDLLASAALRRTLAEANLEPLTTQEVAELLGGIDESRVRHRLARGGLYVLPVGSRGHGFPRWQFHDGKPLPGLKTVLAVLLPAKLHPLEVAGFMSTPQPELVVDGDQVTPREWLITGGEVAPVVSLAANLTQRH